MIRRFIRNSSGATAIEYGLIALLISAATIGGITAVGQSSTVTLQTLADHFK